MLVHRVEADVEVHGVDEPAPLRDGDELRRLGRRHRQGLLADDVAPGFEDLAGLGYVEVVRRGDVDDVDGLVGQEGLQRGIGASHAERLGPLASTVGAAAEDAPDAHADPAQRLDVDGADEARPDDGRADLRDPAHDALLHPPRPALFGHVGPIPRTVSTVRRARRIRRGARSGQRSCRRSFREAR